MSNANKIINVLVLVAAVVAVVLGIMLFNKREDVAQGREMMAKAIADNTAKLIAEEDTKNVRKLTVKTDDLAISKTAEDIQDPLKKFDAATKKMVQQRDALAKYAIELTSIVSDGQGMDAFSAQRLADYTLNQDESTKISGHVTKRMEESKKVSAALVSAVKTLNNNLKMEELDAAKANAGTPDVAYLNERVAAIAEKTQATQSKNDALAAHVKAVAVLMSMDEPALDGADYAATLSAARAAVEQKMTEYNDLVSAKATLSAQIKEAKGQVETASSDMENSKKLLAVREKELEAAQKEIKRLNQIIAPAKTVQTGAKANLNTSFNQLKKVQAKVLYADPKNSFVVISLGKNARIESKDAKGAVVKTDVQIPPNAVMTVASSLDPEKAKFTGKIQIATAGDKESVANILPVPNAAAPAVGDIVYFSNFDLESVRQANEQRLAEMRKQVAQPAADAAAAKDAEMNEYLEAEKTEAEDGVI